MENGAEIDCRRSSVGSKFPLSFWEMAGASTVVLGFGLGLLCVYLTMPASDYSFLKLPHSLEDLQILRDHLESYTSDYTIQVLVGYCMVYIFMQTFMIPGTVFMSLLAGALFGVLKGVALVVFAATAGASSCYFLSKLIGRPLVFSLWPDKLSFFQAQVAKRRESLLNYMLFLRVTPTLPNTFINVASPIVDVPYHIFFLATFIGLIPAAYITVRAGIALGELRSLGDLYDFQAIATLVLIGVASVTPTLMSKSKNMSIVDVCITHCKGYESDLAMSVKTGLKEMQMQCKFNPSSVVPQAEATGFLSDAVSSRYQNPPPPPAPSLSM